LIDRDNLQSDVDALTLDRDSLISDNSVLETEKDDLEILVSEMSVTITNFEAQVLSLTTLGDSLNV
jgi:hypothetical protein